MRDQAYRAAVRERVVRAATRLVGAADGRELFRMLTRGALHDAVVHDGDPNPPSQKAITRAFARTEGGQFDQDLLIDAVLEKSIEDMRAVATANSAGYMEAAQAIEDGAGPEVFVAALSTDLAAWIPGLTDADGDARDRVFYLTVALADDGRTLARLHRIQHQAVKDIYRQAYYRFLEVFDRVLADGVTYEQLFHAISGYLEGVQIPRRFGAEVPDDLVADTIYRTFWSHTKPVNGEEPSPLDLLFSGAAERSQRLRAKLASQGPPATT